MTAPRRILIIQLRRIGDVILTTPALRALKSRYPQAEIDFLVEEPGMQALAGNPDISRILVYHGGPWQTWAWLWRARCLGYDWVIDYLGNPRSALLTAVSGAVVRAGYARTTHRWAYNHLLVQPEKSVYTGLEKILVLKSLGVEVEGQDFMPRVFLASKPAQPENLIGLSPTSRKVTRRWPPASFAELGRLLRERFGCRIVVFWGPGERALAEETAAAIGLGARVCDPTPQLADAARELVRCRLLVTNCNGLKHLAVASGVPTVTVHGSSDPASWTPPHPDHASVRLDELFCIACRLNVCPRHLECFKDLSPQRVLAAVSSLLERVPAP